jgi:transcriptional regulator with XRE-family HTH domain
MPTSTLPANNSPAEDTLSVAGEAFIGSSGERVLSVRQIARGLRWGRQRVEAMFEECPYLDTGRLAFRWEKPPWYPIPIQAVPESAFEELKRRMQEARTGRFVRHGQAYLSPERALLELRVSGAPHVSRELLGQWYRAERCGLDGGEFKGERLKLREKGGGTPEIWYLEAHVFRVKGALLAARKRRKGRTFQSVLRERRDRAHLEQADLAAKLGCSASTVSAWERGRRTPNAEVAARLAEALGVSAGELRIRRPARKHLGNVLRKGFGGSFRDHDGRIIAYTVPRAAKVYSIGRNRLLSYIKELHPVFRHIFPEGRLPCELMLVPGTRTDLERAIRPEDMETLLAGIEKTLRAGQMAHQLRTFAEICDLHDIKQLTDRILVNKLLRALGENGNLTMKQVPRPDPDSKRKWKCSWCYDAAEVNRLLDGQDLAELARSFAAPIENQPGETANGNQSQRPTSPDPSGDRGNLGRPDKNTVLTDFARKQRELTPGITAKEILERFRKVRPNHPIFENEKPAGAFRIAEYRARQKAKRR